MIACFACGTHTRAPAKEIEVANVRPDAAVAPTLPKGCPATFAAAAGGDCDRDAPSCTYPEGSCYCGAAPVCSGMVRSPEWYQEQPIAWRCTANPPAVRPDGCPGTEPGGPCSEEGKQCSYGDCCVTQVQCKGGQWEVGMAACPP